MNKIYTYQGFLNENNEIDRYKNIAVDFIKKLLNIKSDVILKNQSSKFDFDNNTQNMAGVSFPVNGVFTINIDFNDTKFGFIRRLSHEMVHVKQIEDGRLIKIDDTTFKFDGVIYDYKKYKSMYHDELPKFEEEAFGMERILANKFWETYNT